MDLGAATLSASSGAIDVLGIANAGAGVAFGSGARIETGSGAIGVAGIGDQVGLALDSAAIRTATGALDLRGRGVGSAADGLRIGSGAAIATNGGGIALSGEGVGGAGVSLAAGATVDAGTGVIQLRAGNDGGSDAIRLGGTLRSDVAVNLRPGGVDASGVAYERSDDAILLGGSAGFALDSAELGRIDTPELLLGSAQHAGAIRVQEAVARAGNLSLQNQGGAGGIDLQSGVDVGGGTLVLASGGSIVQGTSAALRAHSLLAMAGGDVLLDAAPNDVASTTLAGSAGGDFRFTDANGVAVGTVSGTGYDASSQQTTTLSASGIAAGGAVL